MNRGKGKGNTSKRAVLRDDATAQRLKPGKEKRDFRCVVAALREARFRIYTGVTLLLCGDKTSKEKGFAKGQKAVRETMSNIVIYQASDGQGDR